MKKSLIAIAALALAMGSAMATTGNSGGGNGGCGVGQQTNGCGGTGGTGGSSSVGNVSGGSASVGGVGNGIGNFSPKAEATIEKGAVVNTVSPTATGNTGTIQGGTATTGAIDNKSTAIQGQVQGQAIVGSGNSSISKGAVQVSSTTSGNKNTANGNSVDIKVEGDNQFTVDAARALAGAEGTRGLTEVQVAAIEAQSRVEAAHLAQTIKNTPSVSGPALTSSNDTCMGSSSGSANVPGIGIGFGTSWVDGNCKMLKNSRELWNMGMKAASLALMCNDADNKEALELTGFVCPQTARANKAAELKMSPSLASAPVMSTSSTAYTGTDPIVRARLGLK